MARERQYTEAIPVLETPDVRQLVFDISEIERRSQAEIMRELIRSRKSLGDLEARSRQAFAEEWEILDHEREKNPAVRFSELRGRMAVRG